MLFWIYKNQWKKINFQIEMTVEHLYWESNHGKCSPLTRAHLVFICVADTGFVHKAPQKFMCGFFLPGTDVLNTSWKGAVNLEFETRYDMREQPRSPSPRCVHVAQASRPSVLRSRGLHRAQPVQGSWAVVVQEPLQPDFLCTTISSVNPIL